MPVSRCRPVALLSLLLFPASLAGQRVHRLPATPATVAYGHYSASTKPVLTIRSGDLIDVETLITSRPDRLEAAGLSPDEVEPSLRAIVDEVTDRGPGGHILTGPVYVEGAEPGDVLEVTILQIGLKIAYGYNGCSGFLPENCGAGATTKLIRLDRDRLIGTLAPGVEIPLRPFFGSMGVAPPPSAGRISSNPPGRHAGNLDNKELVAGATLFIPVHAPGALFEIGDGHAAQGDGEVDQTAIETSLTGRLRLTVRKDLHLTWPRAETPTHLIAMGMDPDLTAATRIAVQEAVDLVAMRQAWSRMDAYRFVSIAGDVRITQLVDGSVGVHVMLPKALLGGPNR